MRWSSVQGTTLVEAIIAIGLLAGVVASLAALSAMAVRTATLSRERTLAAWLCVQKMEQLRSQILPLPVSPADALLRDAPGFVEYLDAAGREDAARGAVFVRRWSVRALDRDPDLLVLVVEASPCRVAGHGPACGDATARVRIASVRPRPAW
ncbi:MAG: hypothetical protein NTY02_17615 [Acidobacteria bacterium]|nr:hypothetical protein [Acidobacteriota bacterium]